MSDHTPRSTAAPGPDSIDIGSLTADTALEVLSNERRRHVIRCMLSYDDPIALANLAAEVAALEAGTETTAVSKEDAKDVYVSLSHAAVPKLADADIVDYDRTQNTVTLTRNAAELRPLLDVVDDWPL